MGSTIGRTENEMQVLLRLHVLSSAHAQADGVVPWATIKKKVLRSRPPCAEKIDEMIAFVITKSGGASGQYIKYLSRFHRNGVKASARSGVPASLYEALGSLQYQYLAVALLETAWTCPKEFVNNKECSFVGAAEVNAMAKAEEKTGVLQRLRAAERLLANARAYAGAFFQKMMAGGLAQDGWEEGASSNQAVVLFTKLDVWVGR